MTEQEQPSDTIPLAGAGALTSSGSNWWLESFGISLLPFVVVTLARFIFAGFTPSVIGPVDLSFAMLSAAAVLAVQLVTTQHLRKARETVPLLIVIVAFAMAFTATAIATTDNLDSDQAALTTSAHAAVGALTTAAAKVSPPRGDSMAQGVRLQDRLRNAATTLGQNVASVDHDSGFTRQLILTILLSIVFLAYALRAWSRL